MVRGVLRLLSTTKRFSEESNLAILSLSAGALNEALARSRANTPSIPHEHT